MLQEKIYPHNKDFQTECEQIEYWDEALFGIQKQISFFNEILKTKTSYFSSRNSFILEKTHSYNLNCQKLSSEPSNLFFLTQVIIDTLTKSSNTNKEKFQSLYTDLSVNLPEQIQNIQYVRENIIDSSNQAMTELTETVNYNLNISKNYKKIKSSLDEAHMNKKKIEAKVKYTYDITAKEKADNRVLENLKEMENLLPLINKSNDDIKQKTEKFNSMMRDNFEIAFYNIFKSLASLHQCFFLLSKAHYDCSQTNANIYQNTLKQLSNFSIQINDYTERKFAELQGIKFDSIEMMNLNNENSTNPMQLNILCDNILNYIVIFTQCMRIRKNIIKIFLKHFQQLIDFEDSNTDIMIKKENKLSSQLSEVKYLTEDTLRSWKNMLLPLYKEEKLPKSTGLILEAENFINDSRNAIHCFVDNWKKYEKKLTEGKNQIIALINQINADNAKKGSKKANFHDTKYSSKTKSISKHVANSIRETLDFIKTNIIVSREKELKRITNLIEAFSKFISTYENISCQVADLSQNEIERSTSLDLFEECLNIFSIYFEKFQIQGYEAFLEKIKLKILLKTDFQNDKLGQSAFEHLNDFSSNMNNGSVIYTSKENKFKQKDIESEISSLDKQHLEREIILEPHKEGSIINKTISSPSKDMKSIFSSTYDHNINFIKSENINNIIEETKNPYQNFREPEITNYKSKLEQLTQPLPDKKEIELDEGEELIDSFTCAYKMKILLQGKMHLTTKKIVFVSPFNSSTIFGKGGTKLIIPLKDIKDISKKSNLKIFQNSLEIQTDKSSLFFTSFISRDSCFNLLTITLNEYKAQHPNESNATNQNEESTYSGSKLKYHKIKLKKSKQIAKMLNAIDFTNKLNEINEQRLQLFKETYESNLDFLPIAEFKTLHVDEKLTNAPPCIVFSSIFNQLNEAEIFNHGKGFFESIYIDRNDLDLKVTIDENENKIPQFYSDYDYVLNLFSNFDQKELQDFITSINEWNHIYKFRIELLHPIKKYFVGPDKVNLDEHYTVYFVSPKCFVVHCNSYGVGFPFSESFVSITQYRFDTEYMFNQNKGRFEFKTHCSIRFDVKFIKSCMFQGQVAQANYSQAEEGIKFFTYEKMKVVVDSQASVFEEMFQKMSDDNIHRKIMFKEVIGECNEDEESENDEEVVNNEMNVSSNEMNENKEDVVNQSGAAPAMMFDKTDKGNEGGKGNKKELKKKLIMVCLGVVVLNLILGRVAFIRNGIKEVFLYLVNTVDFTLFINAIIIIVLVYLLITNK